MIGQRLRENYCGSRTTLLQLLQHTQGHLDVPDAVLFDVDERGAGGVLALRDSEPPVVDRGVEEASQFAREVGDVRLVEDPNKIVLAGVLRCEGGEARQLLIYYDMEEVKFYAINITTLLERILTAQLLIFYGRL